MLTKVSTNFRKLYQTEPEVFLSPGRINLIGEHTDYNQGFVLPAAIDKGIYVAIANHNSTDFEIYSETFQNIFKGSLDHLPSQKTGTWADYVLGVLHELLKRNIALKGFKMLIDGDIPSGAGLSSSAALECAIVYALDKTQNIALSPLETIKIAQAAEHNFVGLKCGIMDMYASVMAKKNMALHLDCRSNTHRDVPLELGPYSLVLFNTNIKHNLADSAYNTRRQQCQEAVDLIKVENPNVESLRDVNLEMLNKYVLPKDELVYTRSKYVVEENQRVLNTCQALEKNDFISFGQNLYLSHEGLKNQYEVSCKELDILVDIVKSNNYALGARMMGGGFGGCTLNLIPTENLESVISKVEEAYFEKTKINPSTYIVKTADGTAKLS
jgi:galactokinase